MRFQSTSCLDQPESGNRDKSSNSLNIWAEADHWPLCLPPCVWASSFSLAVAALKWEPMNTHNAFPSVRQTRATARQHKQSAGACCCFTPQPVILGLELHFCPCSSELTAPATESINTLQCRKCFIINPLAFVLFAQWHHGRLLSE